METCIFHNEILELGLATSTKDKCFVVKDFRDVAFVLYKKKNKKTITKWKMKDKEK